MSELVTVRVADGDVWVDGDHLTRGDEVDVPAAVYERIPNSFDRLEDDTSDQEVADSDESEATDGAEDLTIEDLDPHPDDLTVDQLRDRVDDVVDVELLETILEAEQADGSPRSTAVDAIGQRLDELEG